MQGLKRQGEAQDRIAILVDRKGQESAIVLRPMRDRSAC